MHCLRRGQPAVYDVTDDWRWVDTPYYIYRRTVRSEDRLALRASTIVCNEVLRRRWGLRYGLTAPVVHNGIDEQAWAVALAVCEEFSWGERARQSARAAGWSA